MQPRLVLTCWALAIILFGVGCGLDQNDMRKYAIKRPSDEELENAGPRPTSVPSPVMAASSQDAGTTPDQGTNGAGVPSTPPTTAIPTITAPATLPASSADPTTSPGQTSVTATGLSDTRSPESSLSLTERRRISIENMTRIAKALESYLAEHGSYPAAAIHSSSGQPVLSWRVAILPYLGYAALYNQFHLNEPWDSPHNQHLMAKIPAVYQSPERFDARTNYVVPVGSVTAFFGRTGNPPRRWEDRPENTALLLEVDDSASVPWTAPQDWQYLGHEPKRNLGGLRDDGFFVVWGGGTMGVVAQGTSDKDLRAMFTTDGGESLFRSSISQPAVAELAQLESPAAAVPGAAPASGMPSGSVLSERPPSAGTVRRNETSTGSDQWSQLASDAAQAGLEGDAIQLALAAYLMDEPSSTVQYQWIPALRRPAAAIQFGLGIDYTGTWTDSVMKQFSPSDESKSGASGRLQNAVGELGPMIIETLEGTSPILPGAITAVRSSRRSSPEGPPLTLIGVGSARTLARAARLKDIDLLLLFTVDEKKTRSGHSSKSVQFSLWDTWSSKRLFRTAEVNYLRRKHARTDPLYRDPLDVAVDDFRHFLSSELAPEPIPREIQPKHALHRATALANTRRDNPLPILAEIKLYRDQNLLEVKDLVAAFQQVIGPAAGLELVAGTAAEKQEAIAEWIPRLDLDREALARRTDDDD